MKQVLREVEVGGRLPWGGSPRGLMLGGDPTWGGGRPDGQVGPGLTEQDAHLHGASGGDGRVYMGAPLA